MYFEAYIICWNEAQILPWILDYWNAAGIDNLIVYDNKSDDRTLDLLKQKRSYNIEVRSFDTGNRQDNAIFANIKNNCWKDSTADWVFIGDTDEVLYYPGNLKTLLAEMQRKDVSIIQPNKYEIIAWQLPLYMAELLHTYPSVHLFPIGPNKTNLFQPARVREINYDWGSHHCSPEYTGRYVYAPGISHLHAKKLGVEYLIKRNAIQYERLPEKVRQEQLTSTHYLPGMDVHYVAHQLADMWSQSINSKQMEWTDELLSPISEVLIDNGKQYEI